LTPRWWRDRLWYTLSSNPNFFFSENREKSIRHAESVRALNAESYQFDQRRFDHTIPREPPHYKCCLGARPASSPWVQSATKGSRACQCAELPRLKELPRLEWYHKDLCQRGCSPLCHQRVGAPGFLRHLLDLESDQPRDEEEERGESPTDMFLCWDSGS
jgi:hypothetical protein